MLVAPVVEPFVCSELLELDAKLRSALAALALLALLLVDEVSVPIKNPL